LKPLQLTERPIRITKKMVDDTIAQFEGILERALFDTRVATVKPRTTIDGRSPAGSVNYASQPALRDFPGSDPPGFS
jgi:hypothetical protein